MSDEESEGSWFLVIRRPTPEDDEFTAELKTLNESNDWKVRAIAGRVTRSAFGELFSDQLEQLDRHGMTRAHTDEERRAWRFGFDWKPKKERP